MIRRIVVQVQNQLALPSYLWSAECSLALSLYAHSLPCWRQSSLKRFVWRAPRPLVQKVLRSLRDTSTYHPHCRAQKQGKSHWMIFQLQETSKYCGDVLCSGPKIPDWVACQDSIATLFSDRYTWRLLQLFYRLSPCSSPRILWQWHLSQVSYSSRS